MAFHCIQNFNDLAAKLQALKPCLVFSPTDAAIMSIFIYLELLVLKNVNRFFNRIYWFKLLGFYFIKRFFKLIFDGRYYLQGVNCYWGLVIDRVDKYWTQKYGQYHFFIDSVYFFMKKSAFF